MITPTVSLIICTRNHAVSLRPTLASLAGVTVAPDLAAELIIADNGSTDDTEAVADGAAAMLPNFAGGVQYLFIRTPGQCFARNAGLAAARGEVILFTDDDLRFPPEWLESVCRPILENRTDAMVGGVRLAPELERPWMTGNHRSWLACTDNIDSKNPWLVGANHAFHRRVLEKVPAYDTELGPGRLGFGDDTLFGEQLREAGYRIGANLSVCVTHHPDADRILRKSYLSSADKMGRSLAYRAYHWYHEEHLGAALQGAKNQLLLAVRRAQRRGEWERAGWPSAEGMPFWEMHYVQFCAFYDQWQKETQRPRLYEKRGLKKKKG